MGNEFQSYTVALPWNYKTNGRHLWIAGLVICHLKGDFPTTTGPLRHTSIVYLFSKLLDFFSFVVFSLSFNCIIVDGFLNICCITIVCTIRWWLFISAPWNVRLICSDEARISSVKMSYQSISLTVFWSWLIHVPYSFHSIWYLLPFLLKIFMFPFSVHIFLFSNFSIVVSPNKI